MDRPMLFNGEMVRAILEGRKTETRRVMKRQKEILGSDCRKKLEDISDEAFLRTLADPPAEPGDRIWVRESFGYDPGGNPVYRATDPDALDRWKPSIHMPRTASRIMLRVKKVRVERLHQITIEGIGREGIELYGKKHWQAVEAFGDLWERTARPGTQWNDDPYVWVIEFEKEQMEG